ncbi:MAG: NADH-quinone oxidoreductase subunit NuoK [Acidobacteria bacterium]|jgi:NADH-quinone oxidoreductase subunit K|nr:NADH-quinone oxidoreductase subunit NuoK [Acidobacteriota bacterium]
MSPATIIPIPHTWVLALSAVLFVIGTIGVLLRRNGIAIFLSLEIMLNSANLAFVAFALQFAAGRSIAVALTGQLFVFFIIGIAAAEAAVGLALFIALHRLRETIDVDRFNILRW